MSSANFYTPWVDAVTEFTAVDMNAPLITLDKALSYTKNLMVSCAGTIKGIAGTLTWNGVITIVYLDENGNAIVNTIAAGSLALAANQFAYANLSATNNAVITMAAGTATGGSASTFKANNCIVFAFRRTAENIFLMFNQIEDTVQNIAWANSVTVNWALGNTARMIFDRTNVVFTFTGGYPGQRCNLELKKQSVSGENTVSFGAEVRGRNKLASPPSLSGELVNYLGYIYDGTDNVYVFVAFV
jgi:hypothetical protein